MLALSMADGIVSLAPHWYSGLDKGRACDWPARPPATASARHDVIKDNASWQENTRSVFPRKKKGHVY